MKRILDIFLSLLAVIILLPLWIIVAIAIFAEDRGPICFRQTRLGQDGILFILYKFRSMRVNQIPPLELGAIKHNHALVTSVGYVIRRFKIDETLQFLNVLKGDMSLVGPRPCLPQSMDSMTTQEKKRFACLPGLTGWAEVNGNVELLWEEQLLLDLWYVENRSLYLDILILLRTIGVVVCGSHRNETALNLARNTYRG